MSGEQAFSLAGYREDPAKQATTVAAVGIPKFLAVSFESRRGGRSWRHESELTNLPGTGAHICRRQGALARWLHRRGPGAVTADEAMGGVYGNGYGIMRDEDILGWWCWWVFIPCGVRSHWTVFQLISLDQVLASERSSR